MLPETPDVEAICTEREVFKIGVDNNLLPCIISGTQHKEMV